MYRIVNRDRIGLNDLECRQRRPCAPIDLDTRLEVFYAVGIKRYVLPWLYEQAQGGSPRLAVITGGLDASGRAEIFGFYFLVAYTRGELKALIKN